MCRTLDMVCYHDEFRFDMCAKQSISGNSGLKVISIWRFITQIASIKSGR